MNSFLTVMNESPPALNQWKRRKEVLQYQEGKKQMSIPRTNVLAKLLHKNLLLVPNEQILTEY